MQLCCRIFWLLTIVVLPVSLFGQQQDSTEYGAQETLEGVFDDFDPEDAEFDSEQLTQFLQDLAANPLNLNLASVEDLTQIPGINLVVARAIVRYRKDVKPFESIAELKEVSGIGEVTLTRLRPYVTIGSRADLRRALLTDPNYWTTGGGLEVFSRYRRTLQQQQGFERPDSSGFVGSQGQYYQRARYLSDHLSFNITQEKDAGEQLGGPADFDYNSFHLSVYDIGRLKRVVVGDYNLSVGQGMVLWNGGAFGKGRDVIGTANRNGRGVRPYSSAQETNFYRGIAVTYGGDFEVSGFYSQRDRSASELQGDTVRFPTESGFHRTVNELQRRNNLGETFYGGRAQYEFDYGVIGATGYHVRYDRYISQGNRLSDLFDFRGTQNTVLGVDAKIIVGEALFYGEAGRSESGGIGAIAGVEYALGNNTELALSYRNFQRDFQSFFGDGFGEVSGDPQNEQGIYLGVRHQPTDWLTLSAYFDQYRFEAPRFGLNQPSDGHDWLGLAEVEINRDLSFFLLARGETKGDEFETTDSFGRTLVLLGEEQYYRYQGQVQYWVNRSVRLRSRVEFVNTAQAGEGLENGFLLFQDLRWQPSEKWTIDARITLFDTDSFDSRVYQFENDLLYVLSNTALSGQGQRMYLLLNYEPLDYLEIWAKIGVTVFENTRTISSGLSQIEGDTRSNIGLQARLKF